jgi:hypothetical protein
MGERERDFCFIENLGNIRHSDKQKWNVPYSLLSIDGITGWKSMRGQGDLGEDGPAGLTGSRTGIMVRE